MARETTATPVKPLNTGAVPPQAEAPDQEKVPPVTPEKAALDTRPVHRQPHKHESEAPMPPRARIWIGSALAVISVVVLAHLVWVWAFASRLAASAAATKPPSHPLRVHYFGLAFTPTLDWSLVMLVLLASAAGSLAHSALVFSNRAGQRTLESPWKWWYLLRPGASAIIGVLAYVILQAGFLGSVNDANQNNIAFAAGVGALAGMFTDTLMKKLAGALGASDFELPTAAKEGAGQPEPAAGAHAAKAGK